MDLIATHWAKHSKPLAIDLTVAHPLCASHVAVAAVAPEALLRQLERGKREKHEPACGDRLEFLPFAFTSLGGWGSEAHAFFAKLFPTQRAAGDGGPPPGDAGGSDDAPRPGSGVTDWEAVTRRRQFFQRVSVALQRANADMVTSRAVMVGWGDEPEGEDEW